MKSWIRVLSSCRRELALVLFGFFVVSLFALAVWDGTTPSTWPKLGIPLVAGQASTVAVGIFMVLGSSRRKTAQ